VKNRPSPLASPGCPHFQFVTVDGDVLGPRELGRPDWPGSVIYTGPDEPNLRVVRILERDDERGEDPEWFMVLVRRRGVREAAHAWCHPGVVSVAPNPGRLADPTPTQRK
jgi:hypothetical protein